MVSLLLFLAIPQLTTAVSVWDNSYNTGEFGMHVKTNLSVFPTAQVNQTSHCLKSQEREKPEYTMEGLGEELSRSTRGVLSSLLAKAKGKVRVLNTWYKGDQDQDQNRGSPSVFAFSQPATLTASPASSSPPTHHGPWVTLGSTASPSDSLTRASQGSRFG